ncbi:prolyl oligopeptidase family serine peptidase, partial [Aestuariivirga sp.]|uniref:alpha/beta hydrolase family protein n=1 Tax=Aestuariivirga sp. TaxID=2650926 RepID=UPI00301B42E4
ITLSTVDSALRVRAVPFAPLIAPRPFLIIHSRADESVPYQQAEELAAAAGDPCRLVLLDESPHCFWIGNDSVAVQEETREWLVQHL